MIDFAADIEATLPHLRTPQPQRSGTLVRLVGMTLEARGVMAPLGACCEVVGKHGHSVEAVTSRVREAIEYHLAELALVGERPPVEKSPRRSYAIPVTVRAPRLT